MVIISIVGFPYIGLTADNVQQRCDSSAQGFVFEFEPQNQYDPNAIRVLVDGSPVGHVAASDTVKLKPLLLKQTPLRSFIVAVKPRSILCKVNST
jgi:hypothetical protein